MATQKMFNKSRTAMKGIQPLPAVRAHQDSKNKGETDDGTYQFDL